MCAGEASPERAAETILSYLRHSVGGAEHSRGFASLTTCLWSVVPSGQSLTSNDGQNGICRSQCVVPSGQSLTSNNGQNGICRSLSVVPSGQSLTSNDGQNGICRSPSVVPSGQSLTSNNSCRSLLSGGWDGVTSCTSFFILIGIIWAFAIYFTWLSGQKRTFRIKNGGKVGNMNIKCSAYKKNN